MALAPGFTPSVLVCFFFLSYLWYACMYASTFMCVKCTCVCRCPCMQGLKLKSSVFLHPSPLFTEAVSFLNPGLANSH